MILDDSLTKEYEEEKGSGKFKLKSGKFVVADGVFWCVEPTPQTQFLEKNFLESLTPSKYIKVTFLKP